MASDIAIKMFIVHTGKARENAFFTLDYFYVTYFDILRMDAELDWFSKQRRSRSWKSLFLPNVAIIRRNMVHYSMLGDDEQMRLQRLIQIFMAEKSWEGWWRTGAHRRNPCDNIRTGVAADSEPSSQLFRWSLKPSRVYPSEMMLPERKPGFFETVLEPLQPELLHLRPGLPAGTGLAWDTTLDQGRHSKAEFTWFIMSLPINWTCRRRGDGTPRLRDREEYRDWVKPAHVNI